VSFDLIEKMRITEGRDTKVKIKSDRYLRAVKKYMTI
jgi:hypothetical protein